MLTVEEEKEREEKEKELEILIVDDQPYNLFVFEEMISPMKEVKLLEKALNGCQALEKLEMRLK